MDSAVTSYSRGLIDLFHGQSVIVLGMYSLSRCCSAALLLPCAANVIVGKGVGVTVVRRGQMQPYMNFLEGSAPQYLYPNPIFCPVCAPITQGVGPNYNFQSNDWSNDFDHPFRSLTGSWAVWTPVGGPLLFTYVQPTPLNLFLMFVVEIVVLRSELPYLSGKRS